MEGKSVIKRVFVTNRALDQFRRFDPHARAGPLAENLKGAELTHDGRRRAWVLTRGYAVFVFRRRGGPSGGGVGCYVLVAVELDR